MSLEPTDVRAAALEDPRGFLEMYPSPVIFDEVQYAPNLLPYVKEKIDADRDRNGQYLLTGSQNLLLMEKVTESLAGHSAPGHGFSRQDFPKGPGRQGNDRARGAPWRDRPSAWSRCVGSSVCGTVAYPKRMNNPGMGGLKGLKRIS